MWVCASTVSVTWVEVPSAAIRSSSATTSVRACTASVVADCETKSTRMAAARGRESHQTGHHPSPQDVVVQGGAIGFDPDLHPGGVLHQFEESR